MPTTEEILAAVDTGEWLAHHGIEGQKWGKRNGPPYPLDKSDYSKAEKKALKNDKKELQRKVNTSKAYERASNKAQRKGNDLLADNLNEQRKTAEYEAKKMYDDMVKKYGQETVGKIPNKYKNVDAATMRNIGTFTLQELAAGTGIGIPDPISGGTFTIGTYNFGKSERKLANQLYKAEQKKIEEFEDFRSMLSPAVQEYLKELEKSVYNK